MKRLFVVLFLAMGMFACSDSGTGPEENNPDYSKLAEGFAAGAKVILYGEKNPEVGYNRLFVALQDSITGEALDDAHVSLEPLMEMPTMTHSAPVENPAGSTPVAGYWPGAVVFLMSGDWHVEVHVHNHATNVHGHAAFHLDVAPGSDVQVATGADGALYFLTKISPAEPKVGMNAFEVAIHKRENMMSHPAVSGLSLEMTPTMPSMGHGSPNNVNPVHQQDGHYQGEVNFTMSGDWDIALGFASAQDSLGTVNFQLTVQ